MIEPSISEIEPRLFLGNETSSYDIPTLEKNNITAIVSLVDSPISFGRIGLRKYVPKNRHIWLECADSSTQNLLVHMGELCDFIDRMLLPIQPLSLSLLSQQNPGTHVE